MKVFFKQCTESTTDGTFIFIWMGMYKQMHSGRTALIKVEKQDA